MKRILALLIGIMLLFSAVAGAEDLAKYTDEELAQLASDIAEEQAARAAAPEEEPEEVEAPAYETLKNGSRGEYVKTLQAKLKELGVLSGQVDGIFGNMTEKAVKALQQTMGWEQSGAVDEAQFDAVQALETGDGVNLVPGSSDQWSDWMKPEYDKENKTFNIATVVLGEKAVGDAYTCQVEIEFSGVTATKDKKFGFLTQGAVDGAWEAGNIWNSSLVKLSQPPKTGVQKFVHTSLITEKNVDSKLFTIGFRCDNWSAGSFRVRRVQIEKGLTATGWTESYHDLGDGVNLAMNASSEWSDWMEPGYDAENRCFTIDTIELGDKEVGDAYTCQIEIEFSGVTATEGQKFGFWAQGAVDGAWEGKNIWNTSLVKLTEVPQDSAQTYTATQRFTEKNIDARSFDLGFRCDYWASGAFRVRCLKIEKGATATAWSAADIAE